MIFSAQMRTTQKQKKNIETKCIFYAAFYGAHAPRPAPRAGSRQSTGRHARLHNSQSPLHAPPRPAADHLASIEMDTATGDAAPLRISRIRPRLEAEPEAHSLCLAALCAERRGRRRDGPAPIPQAQRSLAVACISYLVLQDAATRALAENAPGDLKGGRAGQSACQAACRILSS